MIIRVPRPQTDYDRAMDIEKWRRLGRAPSKWPDPLPIVRCRAQTELKQQCKMLAVFPVGGPLYCTMHMKTFNNLMMEVK